MGTRTPIKDGIGRIIGMISTLDNGDQLLEQWPGQKIVAKYVKQNDTTVEWKTQRLAGKGNLMLMFLNQRPYDK